MQKLPIKDWQADRRSRDIFRDSRGTFWRIFQPADRWQLDLASEEQGYLLRRVNNGQPEEMALGEYLEQHPAELTMDKNMVYEKVTLQDFCKIFSQSAEYELKMEQMDTGDHIHCVCRGTYSGQSYEMLRLIPKASPAA